MTEEIAARLAALGVDQRWIDIGVVSDDWLSPGAGRGAGESAVEQLQQALFNFLTDRMPLSDDDFAQLLELAVQRDVDLAHEVATWPRHVSVAQLEHAATYAECRPYATQRLRFLALQAGQPVPVRVGKVGDGPTRIELGTRDHHPRVHTALAWERTLSSDEALQLGALFAAIPRGEQARCHEPGYCLRLDPDTPDEVRISICFTCNNLYYDGGLLTELAGLSTEGRALLAWLASLAPTPSSTAAR